MKGKILVVGGYGGVGRFISTALGDRFPGEVVVAGRNYRKAQNFASETNNKVIPAKLDISSMDEVGSSLDDNVTLVVMCVENQDTKFVEQCISRGIDYVDISATYELLSQIRIAAVKKIYLKLLGSFHMGSDVFIAQAVADGAANGKPASYTCSVTGHEEGRVTGLVAAEVAEHLYTSATSPGVFHIEQLFGQPREVHRGFQQTSDGDGVPFLNAFISSC